MNTTYLGDFLYESSTDLEAILIAKPFFEFGVFFYGSGESTFLRKALHF